MAVLSVALRKESVDRNRVKKRLDGFEGRSLSARRAWIEIRIGGAQQMAVYKSLSARRAWIEIPTIKAMRGDRKSLSARRAWIEIAGTMAT